MIVRWYLNLPKEAKEYLVTIRHRHSNKVSVSMAYYDIMTHRWKFDKGAENDVEVLAWTKKPCPYIVGERSAATD